MGAEMNQFTDQCCLFLLCMSVYTAHGEVYLHGDSGAMESDIDISQMFYAVCAQHHKA